MPRTLLLTPVVVLLVAIEAAVPARTLAEGRATGQRSAPAGTWSARSSTGLVLRGTWTAEGDPKTGTVAGTWTLRDARGRTAAGGGWSAAKSPAGWTGTWRATVSGRTSDYSGTWSADIDLEPDALLTGLLEKALEAAVSGRWRAGRQSGAWSIRAFN